MNAGGGKTTENLRRHPRFRVALRCHVAMPHGTVTATTVGVSRNGMSVRLSPTPALNEDLPVTLELPNGTSIDGRARTKTVLPGCLCGMTLSFGGESQAHWDAFLDEEESTGSLWRMIGRWQQDPDDEHSARRVIDRDRHGQPRFHAVGENGEAYRICFAREDSDAPAHSDLAVHPGFLALCGDAVRAVLRRPLTLRFDDDAGGARVQSVRVCALVRGGYAGIQGLGHGDDDDDTLTLTALGQGELILVEQDGQAVFPRFTPLELEQIACDTFRVDLRRPVFGLPQTSTGQTARARAQPAPVPLPPLPTTTTAAKPAPATRAWAASASQRLNLTGFDSIRFAQAAADDVQMRRYGDRDVWFHPSVWARLKTEGGEGMGPTLQDGTHICLLVLVGPGAPRVVRLGPDSDVTLLNPPR